MDEETRQFAVRLLAQIEGAILTSLNRKDNEQLAKVLRYALGYLPIYDPFAHQREES